MSDLSRELEALAQRGLIVRHDTPDGPVFGVDPLVASQVADWMAAHPDERRGLTDEQISISLGRSYAASFEALADGSEPDALDQAAEEAQHALRGDDLADVLPAEIVARDHHVEQRFALHPVREDIDGLVLPVVGDLEAHLVDIHNAHRRLSPPLALLVGVQVHFRAVDRDLFGGYLDRRRPAFQQDRLRADKLGDLFYFRRIYKRTLDAYEIVARA